MLAFILNVFSRLCARVSFVTTPPSSSTSLTTLPPRPEVPSCTGENLEGLHIQGTCAAALAPG